MKRCRACGETKQDADFSVGKAQCKPCRARAESAAYWRNRDATHRRILPRDASGKIVRAAVPPIADLREAFWSQVDKGDGCWLWRGKVNRRHGYGYFYVPGTGSHVRAHRFAWSLHSGQAVPGGMHVLHSCDTRDCVNPSHLRIGTREDNMRDMVSRGRHASQRRALAARIAALLPPEGA